MRLLSALVLILALPAANAGLGPVVVSRSNGPVAVERDQVMQAVEYGTYLSPGGTLLTGSDALLELRTHESSWLRLGPRGDLLLHDVIETDSTREVRTVLLRGALRVDAARAIGGETFRINVGRLRLKLAGSDAWISLRDAVETICVFDGIVEIQGPVDDLPERFADTGRCLVLDGGSLRTIPASDAAIASRVAATEFGAAAKASAAAPPSPAAATTAAPNASAADADAADTPPATAEPAAPTSKTDESEIEDSASSWTIVLGSFSTEARALGFAGQQSSALGELSVVTHNRNGKELFRVIRGRYPSRVAARTAAEALRERGTSAWITPR